MTTPRRNLLVVDDDPCTREFLELTLRSNGHAVDGANDGRGALRKLSSNAYDLVLTDVNMPRMNGYHLLSTVQETYPDTRVIIFTGFGDVESAVLAIKSGASDFLTKPVDIQKLLDAVEGVLQVRRKESGPLVLRRQGGLRDGSSPLLGRSQAMRRTLERMSTVAPTDTSVLLLGESGTGKELMAREIHRLSPRGNKKLVAVNCGCLSETLLDSELFGHERGAFTGAITAREGLFEAAAGGTIFLDEIGAMPMTAQVRLLRVLEEKEVRRLGSTICRSVDVRVLAATNMDLDAAIEAGTFRPDLYYRLSSVVITLPPLRERAGDLHLLATRFLAEACGRSARPVPGLCGKALEFVLAHNWPGNVRELKNAMENVALFAQSAEVLIENLPFVSAQKDPTAEMPTMEEIEKRHIRGVLLRAQGNKVVAARLLGIPRTTLYRKLRKHQLGSRE